MAFWAWNEVLAGDCLLQKCTIAFLFTVRLCERSLLIDSIQCVIVKRTGSSNIVQCITDKHVRYILCFLVLNPRAAWLESI